MKIKILNMLCCLSQAEKAKEKEELMSNKFCDIEKRYLLAFDE